MTLTLEEMTKGLKTKSEKIRTLGRAGVPTSEIARHLGIRYQHARNVLVDAGLYREARSAANAGFAEDSPRGLKAGVTPLANANEPGRKHVWTDIGRDGSVIIPADLLQGAGLEPGDRVFMARSECGLELLSRESALLRAQQILAPFRREGVSEVDEFLKDRRSMWGEG